MYYGNASAEALSPCSLARIPYHSSVVNVPLLMCPRPLHRQECILPQPPSPVKSAGPPSPLPCLPPVSPEARTYSTSPVLPCQVRHPTSLIPSGRPPARHKNSTIPHPLNPVKPQPTPQRDFARRKIYKDTLSPLPCQITGEVFANHVWWSNPGC
jgi:hypothetical protein